MKAIIIAGGGGARLWPMSRKTKPKQFYKLVSNEPLIRETYNRFTKDYKPEDIYISTTPPLQKMISRLFPKLPPRNIIIEPEKRDTAAAMGYVACSLALEDPHEPIAFVPADHYIVNNVQYLKCFRVAEKLIRQTSRMIDIGITPNFPSTNLGYTKIAGKFQEIDDVDIYYFKGHKEKPNLVLAKKYLASGNFFWHASYYMWTPQLFLEAYKKYAPDLYKPLIRIQKALAKHNKKIISKEYAKLRKISFDYAITEKMDPQEVLIIKGDFGWSDIGAWDVLYDKLSSQGKNIIKGKVLTLDTKGSLIYGHSHKVIAAIGLNDMIVVDTPDALLICPHSQTQEVKKIVQRLEKEGLRKYL